MLSFEEKKAIFHSFKLKEKKISNGRVSFVYPESKQKGQVLATQLHPSGNGYVIGKYMSEETIQKHGYQVDSRGWISIKVFSKEEIARVITEAMKSMAGSHQAAELAIASLPKVEAADNLMEGSLETMRAPIQLERKPERHQLVEDKQENGKIGLTEPAAPFEMYPGSCLFAWLGLTLSTMEYGFSVWQKAVRKYAGLAANWQSKR
ncbi:hypothetical protein [Neobacillus jeddahensis]|uniref:hypothetical protein n=1 Tax=Neobacillus jeddahensis TaxID=1461580 RepID=UPI0006942AB2|nr:hypothetical protein [Neobacillus jeddahensis]